MATDVSAMFVRVEVDADAANDKDLAKKLAEVCPVNIFGVAADGTCTVLGENVDECVLCELCIQAAPPGKVRITKLYDGTVLKS